MSHRPLLCLSCGRVCNVAIGEELCPKCTQIDNERAAALAHELKPKDENNDAEDNTRSGWR